MGSVLLSIFTSSSEPPIYIPTHNKVEPFGELCWNTSALKDTRLLLYQRLEAHFQWTPYDDPVIRAVILDEFFQNLNICHVKVPLVNYATVEMHQKDRVLRQFGFRQLIFVTPEVLDDEHKIDLRQLNIHWLQAIFALEKAEASANPYRKGTTGPFKSKKKG
ncbi:hypothetical protein Goshw_001932 [Gossypium schwendimanii]|uniref:Aminotransferase-like plant mobile domain-containing protein n=1 Tax=Gossypium schwendimanii TaxID=34291 RepID=A0A7J9KPU6_GOSSC|nr:hypothetical protein [Gossypium schwendimanii]